MIKLKQKAQSTIVYVALVALVATALVVVGIYVRRAHQGRARDSADVFGGGAQYDPGVTTVTSN